MASVDLACIFFMGVGCFIIMFIPFIGVNFYSENFHDSNYLPVINCLAYIFSLPCVFAQWKFDEYFDQKFTSKHAFAVRLRLCFITIVLLDLALLLVPGAFPTQPAPPMTYIGIWMVCVSIVVTFATGTLFQYCSFADFDHGEGIAALTVGFCSSSAASIVLAEAFHFNHQPTTLQIWGYYGSVIGINVVAVGAAFLATTTQLFEDTMTNKDHFLKKSMELKEKLGPPQYWLGITQSAKFLGHSTENTASETTPILPNFWSMIMSKGEDADSDDHHSKLGVLRYHIFTNTCLTIGLLSLYKRFPTTYAYTAVLLVYSHLIGDLCSRLFSAFFTLEFTGLNILTPCRLLATVYLALVAFKVVGCGNDWVLIIIVSLFNFFGGAAVNWTYNLLRVIFVDRNKLQKGSQYLTIYYYAGVTLGTVLSLVLVYAI